eukprot:8150715-Pyramimonas_sp.AAC.1
MSGKNIKPAHKVKGYEESEYLATQRKARLKNLEDLEPTGELDEGFEVTGKGYEVTFDEEMHAPITLQEVEEYVAATNAEAWALICQTRKDKAFRLEQERREEQERLAAEEAKKIVGPRLALKQRHLALDDVRVGESARGTVEVRAPVGVTAPRIGTSA